MIVCDLTIPFSPKSRKYRENINKKTSELNDTVNLMHITDIYRIFYPTLTEYTLFSTSYGTFFLIHILF
jgi:hypothetical protein